jgi:hypothetical protein
MYNFIVIGIDLKAVNHCIGCNDYMYIFTYMAHKVGSIIETSITIVKLFKAVRISIRLSWL